MRSARNLRRLSASGLSAVAVVALTTAPAAARPGVTAPSDSTCSLVRSTWQAEAAVDAELTERFDAYGNSGVGWTGGDSTYSVRQRGGRTLWLFSDTFLGPVNPDLSRPTSVPFLNNSFVVEKGDKLTTVTGGTSEQPDSLVPPDEADTWNWLGAGVETRDSLDVMFLEFGVFGPGTWDWEWRENKLVRFDPKTYAVREVVPMPSSADIQWASWIERRGRDTYVYGVEDQGATKYMHLARVSGDDLTQPWSYWTGDGWSPDEQTSARIMPGVANEYSVTRFKDGYLLVTHDTSELFSRNVVAYMSCTPYGPFTRATTLYQTPETGQSGSYGNPNIITYNAHEHPDLRRGNQLLLTYNVNSLDPNADLYDDVTIYRPRFVNVTLTRVHAEGTR